MSVCDANRAPAQAGNMMGGVCCPLQRKQQVQKGKEISPELGVKQKQFPYKWMHSVPQTQSHGGDFLSSLLSPCSGGGSPHTPYTASPGMLQILNAPWEQSQLQQHGRQAASSKQLTALLSHHIMMDEPCPMEMSLSEQSVSSLLSASCLSVEPAAPTAPVLPEWAVWPGLPPFDDSVQA